MQLMEAFDTEVRLLPSGQHTSVCTHQPSHQRATQAFLSQLRKPALPPSLKSANWQLLYREFTQSPHFWPWFNDRRMVRRPSLPRTRRPHAHVTCCCAG